MKILKNTRKTTAILTTAIIFIIATSAILFVNAQANYIETGPTTQNFNKDMGQTVFNAPYSSASSTSYASAVAKWGNLLNNAYDCGHPAFVSGARNCFVDGPAPDRPDVAWTTGDVLMGYSGKNYSYPTIASWTTAPLAMDSQLIGSGSVRLPNNTVVNCLMSVDPLSGTLKWYTPWPTVRGTLLSLASTFVGPRIDKVDDKHFVIDGRQMWSTNGTFIWYDAMMQFGDAYNTQIVAAAPAYKVFGAALNVPGERATAVRAYDLSEPEVDKNIYNASNPNQQLASGRSIWNVTLDIYGNPCVCYDPDDDLLIRGSYGSYMVWAINGTTGEKVWATSLPTMTGYSGCYANGRIYVGCLSVAETCLNATNGQVIWRNIDGEANRGFNVWQVGYAYGRVYYHDLGSGRTGATKCYDAITGQKLWASTSLFSIGYYVFKIADGKVYGSQADGSTTTGRVADPAAFCCWNAYTGEIIWKLRQQVTCPIVAYGSLYIVNSNVLICISTAFQPQNWVEFRGNTEFPGITMDDAPRDLSNGPVWTYQTGAGVIASPVIANGKVYIGSGDRYLYCLDAYNGTEIWKFQTNEPRMSVWGSTCAYYGGVIMTGADDGHFYGLDAETGSLKWTVDAGYVAAVVASSQHLIRSSPMIYNGIAYVGALNNKTYAIDPLTGNVKWSVDTGAQILGSAAFDKLGSMYIMNYNARMYKLSLGADPAGPAAGTILLNFSVQNIQLSGTYSFADQAYTPAISLDGSQLWIGAVGNQIFAYNTTTGAEIFPNPSGINSGRFSTQPHVLAENSHGSLVVVPGNMLAATNQTLSSPTMANGTVWSGFPITYVNGSAANPNVGGPQVPGYSYYKGQYSFGTNVDKIIGQAGPTVFCATAQQVNVTISNNQLPPGATSAQVNPLRLALTGDNIWTDWGGWEVFASPILASFGTNALVYYGSESYAIHCVNASNGVPLAWWTTAGPIGSSVGIYDGKLYFGSADGKVYCFEEHETTTTTTTASVDNASPNAGTPVNVTVKLTSVPTINVYEEIGQAAPIPSIPNQTLTVTFIKPDGTTVVDVPTTTDTYGNAVVQYTPDVAGNWQVVAAYNGQMGPRETFAKSASDVIALTVGGSSATATPTTSGGPTATPTSAATVTPTVAPTSSTEGGSNNMLLYAGIAVVVIVVIVLAALVLMRRKK